MSIDTKKIIIHANEFHAYFDSAAENTLNKILWASKDGHSTAGEVMHYVMTLLENFNRKLQDRLFFSEGDVLFTITTYDKLMRTALELCIEEDVENHGFSALPDNVKDGVFTMKVEMIRAASKAILNDKM